MMKSYVYVYLFDGKDGKLAQERLEFAVEEYCRTNGKQGLWEILQDKETRSRILLVERTETGKPYFKNCSEIHFSISHSGVYWACAIADEPVGFDLQEHALAKGETKKEAVVRFRKMAHRFFHAAEAEFVDLDSYHNFFSVWTAREAYVKFTGQGIDKYFSEHCVVPIQETWQRISGQCKDVNWQALGKYFWKTIYSENYTLCVCTQAPCEYLIIEKEKDVL